MTNIIEMDMAELERRVIAKITEDLQNGIDAYAELAAKAFDIPVEQVTEQQRTLAKRWYYFQLYTQQED